MDPPEKLKKAEKLYFFHQKLIFFQLAQSFIIFLGLRHLPVRFIMDLSCFPFAACKSD